MAATHIRIRGEASRRIAPLVAKRPLHLVAVVGAEVDRQQPQQRAVPAGVSS